MAGQQRNVTRQGAPWWLNAALAAAEQAEQGADDLTPEQRAQLAEAASRLYAAALPPGVTTGDVRRQQEALAAAIFAGGNISATLAGASKLRGMAAIAAAAVITHAARTIPPDPRR